MSSPAIAANRSPLSLFVPLFIALSIAVFSWVFAVGDISEYFHHQMPPGQAVYVFSKLAGLLGGALLTVHIVLILLRDVPVFSNRFVWNTRSHMVLGALTVVTVMCHIGLFVLAASLRGNAPALGLLVPQFGHGPYRTGVSLGNIGAVLLLLMVPLGTVLRRSKKSKTLRNLHRCGIATLALGIVHALIIGSEKTTIIAFAICGAVVVIAIIWRIIQGTKAD